MWVQQQGTRPSLQGGWLEAGTSLGYGIATLQAGAADGSVTVDLTSPSETPYGAVVFRAVDANRMWVLRYAGSPSTGLVGLFRRVDGSFALIQQTTVAPIVPGTMHRLEARFKGSLVQAVWDGVVIFEHTVTDYQTATQHGLLWHSDDPLVRFDNFVVTAQ